MTPIIVNNKIRGYVRHGEYQGTFYGKEAQGEPWAVAQLPTGDSKFFDTSMCENPVATAYDFIHTQL